MANKGPMVNVRDENLITFGQFSCLDLTQELV